MSPPPTYLPLRWESTGDQWWYASPIDWAAANGHYDLVRELIRLDGNHLMKLTSLRRIRRLETVWDDEEQFHDVAKCRSDVARKLFSECQIKDSVIGGWLLYTAASAGDLNFVQELLDKDPLLVFGEGEYGVTDMLYAAARSKKTEVFRVVLDFAAAPRFGEQIGEIPSAYKLEIMKRAVHAAGRGGNLRVLKQLLRDCSDDALAYRDAQGATVLHAAAARGQVEVVKDLASSSPEMINLRDNEGNTALHVAAHRGHLGVVQTLILASPSLINATNAAGETFLHSVVSGFQTPGFRRLDHQIQLLKHLVSGKQVEEIINAKNKQGKTALHLAITGNIHSHLVELLMTVGCIDVNIPDVDGMTPLDILRQRPHSASSDLLTRQLMCAGGMLRCQDYSARKVMASHIKRQSMGSSPGTSFRISDLDIFLYTASSEEEEEQQGSPHHNNPSVSQTKSSSNKLLGSAAQRLKRLLLHLHWLPKTNNDIITPDRLNRLVDEQVPVPLRQRFSKHKRARSNHPSPTPKKKLAVPKHRSRSTSFSKISFSSQSSSGIVEIAKANDQDGPKTSTHTHTLINHYTLDAPTTEHVHPYEYDIYERSVLSAA